MPIMSHISSFIMAYFIVSHSRCSWCHGHCEHIWHPTGVGKKHEAKLRCMTKSSCIVLWLSNGSSYFGLHVLLTGHNVNWKNRFKGYVMVRRIHPAPTGHNSIQGTATAYVCFVQIRFESRRPVDHQRSPIHRQGLLSIQRQYRTIRLHFQVQPCP